MVVGDRTPLTKVGGDLSKSITVLGLMEQLESPSSSGRHKAAKIFCGRVISFLESCPSWLSGGARTFAHAECAQDKPLYAS